VLFQRILGALICTWRHFRFPRSSTTSFWHPRAGPEGDPTVKLIIYLVIGVAVALVVLRFLNSRKPPRQ